MSVVHRIWSPTYFGTRRSHAHRGAPRGFNRPPRACVPDPPLVVAITLSQERWPCFRRRLHPFPIRLNFLRYAMTRMFTVIEGLLLLPIVASTSCDRAVDMEETIHPALASILPVDVERIVEDTLPHGLSSETTARWLNTRNSLLSARSVLTIPANNTDTAAEFGRIWDALVTPSGDLVILDELAQEVRIFDSAGRIVQVIGGIGDGPDEFRFANGIELLRDGRLVVSTRARGIKIFVDTRDGWILDEVIEIPVIPDDLCSVDNRVFISAWGQTQNTVIHEVKMNSKGAHRPFGSGYKADHWLLQSQMADGLVGCLAGPTRVVFAYELVPVVRSFDPNSQANLWTSQIEGFVSPQVVEGFDGGRYVTRRRTSIEDIVGGLHAIDPNHLLLQLARFDAQVRSITISSFLLDAATGRGASLGNSLPVIFDPSPRRYIAMLEDPYPRVELRVIDVGNGGN